MEKIFRITKDKDRAKDLFDMAKDRQEFLKIIPRDKTYKLIEEYYEVIKEVLTAIMYLDGYKTLSHMKLIEYFSKNYEDLNQGELKLVDTLRKFRIGIVYYGRKIKSDFITNNEDSMKKIIKKLFNLTESKLK